MTCSMTEKHNNPHTPRYFIAVFGDPEGTPSKDRIEDGRYIPHHDHWPSGIAEGDVMLLYCTGSYTEHDQKAPSIGIVLHPDRSANSIHYLHLPLIQPIDMETIPDCLSPEDQQKFKNRRFSTFWIFEIERDSFKRLTKGREVNWP